MDHFSSNTRKVIMRFVTMSEIWTGRPAYYIVTLLTAGATAFAVWWWAYFFGPDLNDRGAGMLMFYFPAVGVTVLAGVLSFLLHKQVHERESKLLLAMNFIFLFGYTLILLRICAYMLLPVDLGTGIADTVVESVFMLLLVAGTPVVGYLLTRIIHWDGNKSMHKSGCARM